MIPLVPSARLRASPYHRSTIAAGATGFLPYNRMLIPRGYGDPDAEYERLTTGVSMWDVAVQRQVRLQGPDAANLAQLLCVRDLSKMAIGQGKYAPICNHDGVLINDPIALKIAEDCYWLSIADKDIGFWARCVAGERGLNVAIDEPDVSPLAIQGPKAEDLVAALLGDWVRSLRFFWFQDAVLDGVPLKVARSGFSKQGGFELYLLDGSMGDKLWRLVEEAGEPFGVGPGNPNPSERIEGGLLNWDSDVDHETNPFEVGLGRYVDLDLDDAVIGVRALRRIAQEGPKRHMLGVVLDGRERRPDHVGWRALERGRGAVGHMTNGAWSPKLSRMIGYALVRKDIGAGDVVTVIDQGVRRRGVLRALPFVQ